MIGASLSSGTLFVSRSADVPAPEPVFASYESAEQDAALLRIEFEGMSIEELQEFVR